MTKGVPYSEADKLAALALLVQNGGNLKRTARMLAYDRRTLGTWRDMSQDPAVLNTIDPEVRRERTERWGEVQDIAASRMAALIPEETDLDSVSKAAQVSSQQYLDHRDGRRGTGNGPGFTINGPVQFVLSQETFETI